MLATIRHDGRNFQSIQTKLPKCTYDNGLEKENISKNSMENNSWMVSQKNRSSTLEKLPKIRKSSSARRKLPALKMANE